MDPMESTVKSQVSNENRAPGCLGYIGDYTIYAVIKGL